MSSMTELDSTATNRSNKTRGMLKHLRTGCWCIYALWSVGARIAESAKKP